MNELTPQDLKRNQYLLLLYFFYTIFQGALRKWVFAGTPSVNNVLFLFQLLMPFFVIFYFKKSKSIFAYQPLLLYAAALVLFALNPMNATIYHGMFGFILHFGFWMLMVTYLNERDAFPLEKMTNIFVVVCIGLICLTAIQFTLPATHVLNRYESSDAVDGFENNQGVRVTGTFSYIAGYGSFLYFFGLFIWALMIENKKSVLIILGLAAFGLVSAFMNGSRGMVVPFVLSVLIGIANYGTVSTKIKMVAAVVLVTVLGSIYGLDKKIEFAQRAFNAFYGRVEYGQKSGEAGGRTTKTFDGVIEFTGKYPVLGLGLGATYQGAVSKWGKSQELIQSGYYEEEPERILLEGGFALFTIRCALFVFLASRLKIPLIYTVPVLFYLFFFTQMVFNSYQAFFTFFGLALVDKMYYLKNILKETE